MKFSLILENADGAQLKMTETANLYMVKEIDGLYPPDGTITTSNYANMDGSYLNHAFLEKRNIVINFQMRGIEIENNRHALYKIVKPSKYIKLYYKTKNISVYTEGYVETCNISNFTAQTSGQISVLCPDIYFYSTVQTIATCGLIAGAFHFPFPDSDDAFPIGEYSTSDSLTIQNDGEEIGCIFILENIGGGEILNPIIYNADATENYIQLLTTMQYGDKITICTKIGNKTVILTRNGVDYNIISSFTAGSDWLVLQNGTNRFYTAADANASNLRLTVVHTNAYLGV